MIRWRIRNLVLGIIVCPIVGHNWREFKEITGTRYYRACMNCGKTQASTSQEYYRI